MDGLLLSVELPLQSGNIGPNSTPCIYRSSVHMTQLVNIASTQREKSDDSEPHRIDAPIESQPFETASLK